MKSRGSKALGLLGALLALAIGFAGWAALHKSKGTSVEPQSHVAVEQPGPADAENAAPIAQLPEPPANPRAPEPKPAATSKERVSEARTSADATDAIWISGRLIYPEGTPIGEEVDVLASGRKLKSRDAHRARVETNGNFRIAVEAKSRVALITIDAPHLFLTQPLSVKIKDGKPTDEVLIKPILGGCLQGELRLPRQAEDKGAGLVGRSVSDWGWSSTTFGRARPTNDEPREAIVDSNLRFELRGLDPKLTHSINFDPSGAFTIASLTDVKVAAGETLPIHLDLSLGVRLLGKLTSPGAKLPREMHVYVQTVPLGSSGAGDPARGGEAGSNETYVAVGYDGSFEAKGIPAGVITVRASGSQRTPAVLELGPLGEGEVREGLELALGLGGQIGGRVHLPDGTPAVGARMELSSAGDASPSPDYFLPGRRPLQIGEVLTDVEGRFLINGLEQGPFNVIAQLKVAETAEKGKKRAAPWKARIDGVSVGTRDLELVLHGGYSITGIVLDDAGAPINRFFVSATPELDGVLDPSKRVTTTFSSAEGRFELGGLLDGAHSIEVSALHHEDPLPRRIQVPAESGPFTFIAARQASISGIVLLPDGSPAARATLHLLGDARFSGEPRIAATANSQGEFELNSVSSDAQKLRARLAGYGSSEAWPLQLAPGQVVSGLRLVLLRRDARILVEVHASRAGEKISGRDVHGYCMDGSNHIEGSTDAKGQLVFEHVDPGEWMIGLPPNPEDQPLSAQPDANSAQAARIDSAELRTAKVKVEDAGEVRVVFGSEERATIRITGTVHQGEKALPFVRVRAIPADAADNRDANYASTDGSGRFELAVVRAGKYRVQAMPLEENCMPGGPSLDVPSGGLEGVAIAIPNGRIAGRVHAQGNAASGMLSVTLERSDGDRAWSSPDKEAWPDFDFAFENLQAGSYTLVAAAWLPDKNGAPRKIQGPVKKTIELSEGQKLEEVQIEIEVH